jgi:hypothetical protein
LENLDEDGILIIKWILKNRLGGSGFIWLRRGISG